MVSSFLLLVGSFVLFCGILVLRGFKFAKRERLHDKGISETSTIIEELREEIINMTSTPKEDYKSTFEIAQLTDRNPTEEDYYDYAGKIAQYVGKRLDNTDFKYFHAIEGKELEQANWITMTIASNTADYRELFKLALLSGFDSDKLNVILAEVLPNYVNAKGIKFISQIYAGGDIYTGVSPIEASPDINVNLVFVSDSLYDDYMAHMQEERRRLEETYAKRDEQAKLEAEREAEREAELNK